MRAGRRHARGLASGALATLWSAGCAAAPGPPPPASAEGTDDLVPAGYGTLRQEELTLTLRPGPLVLKVTPLEESVIRLAAPDTYRRLGELALRHRGPLQRRAGSSDVTLFLVSFFSDEPGTVFQPEDVQLVNRGRQHRPLAIQGVTGGWGTQRLRQQETQMAVYAFPELDLSLALTAVYGDARTEEWERILRTMEVERARVRARAGVGR